ncbi:uncharacterized protein LOC119078987 [Bradysia coprophila]|uniref:uncharacterized protein LOC119078987 n=1 Tax=Bradysia coprophila TaxID=38358 RepID=UPI00187DAE5B|nr:uncharacterized protein LOC119078987 [Bradysia coprophila]XP_037042638.1 uncharacterized protein LOC119078987 [Bradysia coprophila]
MGREVDPSDIGKHPELIRKAQTEMTKTDVLVCGGCNEVFHFLEQFTEHKNGNCNETSTLKDSQETKPKVWAFLLWKASQLNSDSANTIVNPWKLYQTWLTLDEAIRETWVVAGRTIQSFARMGQGNLHEMPVKITKTVVDAGPVPETKTYKPAEPKVNLVGRQYIKAEVKPEPEAAPKIMKKVVRSPLAKLPGNPVLLNKVGNANKIAKRTIPDSETNETEEQTVEKILAKRFNPRRKEHEYLVKWENFTHDQNTWEPYTYLKVCPQMLDLFEKQLARQKEQRAAMAAAKQAAEAKAKETSVVNNSFESNDSKGSPVRPGRNSKSKAMDQVKQWISDNNETAAGTNKRKLETEIDFEHEIDNEESEPAVKIIKTESPGSQAVNRINQSGAVRIVSVNKQANSGITHKINGSKSPDKSEMVISAPKEKRPTGIVKKPGVTASPVQKGEAQVRVVQKGESTSGVVRVNNSQTKIVQRPAARSNPPARQTNTVVRPNITTKPAPPRNQPVRQIISQTNRTQIGQTTLAQRSSLSPQVYSSGQKQTVQRTVKSAPSSETKLMQDQKIAALTRHGDLKITRKQMPANSVTQIPSTKIQNVHEDIKDFQTHLTESPPNEMTLCPITGKVLGHGDDDLTHLNSDDMSENEQKFKATLTDDAGLQQLLAAQEDGQPLLVTGEDGTIYQVAGKNEQGQTILIAQGAEGEQQCVYVAADENDEGGMINLDSAVADAMQNMATDEDGNPTDQTQYVIKQDTSELNDPTQQLSIATDNDSQDGQITAEVVQADLPSPGGTRRVVLLLPDGNFMMTEVSDEQYQSLNLVT